MKRLQINSPTEADLNKRCSLENRGTMKLYKKTKLSPSNGGFYDTLTITQKTQHSSNGAFYERLQQKKKSLQRQRNKTDYETYRGNKLWLWKNLQQRNALQEDRYTAGSWTQDCGFCGTRTLE